jgi:hypothetical protein
MAVLQPNRPFPTPAPIIEVNNKLPVGTHTFQLVVEDDHGNQSAPARATLTVRAATSAPPSPQPPKPAALGGLRGLVKRL